jgi:hypothetical protein
LAFTHCGLFTDPTIAYTESMGWYEEQESKTLQELEDASKPQDTEEEDGEMEND